MTNYIKNYVNIELERILEEYEKNPQLLNSDDFCQMMYAFMRYLKNNWGDIFEQELKNKRMNQSPEDTAMISEISEQYAKDMIKTIIPKEIIENFKTVEDVKDIMLKKLKNCFGEIISEYNEWFLNG